MLPEIGADHQLELAHRVSRRQSCAMMQLDRTAAIHVPGWRQSF